MNTQNESPFNNPKFLVAIVATFLGLWGWQYYMNKTYPPIIATPKVAAPLGAAVATNSATTAASATAVVKPTEEKLFNYQDENVSWVISSSGLGLKSFELKKYKDRSNKQVEFSSDKIFSLIVNNQKVLFSVTAVSDTEFKGEAVVDGKKITRILKYDKNKMSFDSKTEFERGIPAISFAVEDKKLVSTGSSYFMPSFDRQEFLFREGDKVKTEPISAVKEGESLNKSAAVVSLASIGTQYFTMAMVDKSETAPSLAMVVQGHDAKIVATYDLSNSQVTSLKQIYYVGAKSTDTLKQIDPLMPEVMDLGVFAFIAKPLMVLMRLLHQILGNWGLAIIGLTLIVRLVLLPFNIMSFRSSRSMQKIQPLLKEIRERYKSDPLKVNKETMALMKEHKANPLSGCLPMLIQIPIFFALWKTIGSSVEIYQQPFFGWITDLSSKDPLFIIPVLMGITMFFQQKLTPTTMDPAQQKILNFMPIIFTVFMVSLPSGLTLYNFVSALFGVTQQYFLLKDRSAKAA